MLVPLLHARVMALVKLVGLFKYSTRSQHTTSPTEKAKGIKLETSVAVKTNFIGGHGFHPHSECPISICCVGMNIYDQRMYRSRSRSILGVTISNGEVDLELR